MKHKILFATCLACMAVATYAQSPQSVPYQGVARDTAGNVMANQNISLRFSIHNGSAGGAVVYKETQATTTNLLGLFTVNIGQGTVVTGTFSGINWSSGTKFLQVEMDATGGASYVDMGTQQMLSVPYALYSDVSGSSSNAWNINGNAGTTSSNFIGTTDSVPLFIMVNNQKAGIIEPGRANAAFGLRSFSSNTIGQSNSAFGNQALQLNAVGSSNTAIGESALKNNGGSDNTAIGKNALSSNINGSSNTAIGKNALGSTNSVNNNRNTAVGEDALLVTAGADNTAVGYGALRSNTTPIGNTAVGKNALQANTNGLFNTATGYEALFSNISGQGNTAFGYRSLRTATTALYNTAFGFNALNQDSIGATNTAVGAFALSSNKGTANTAVGYISLTNNTTGVGNTAVGETSLNSNTTGNSNSCLGYEILKNNTTGSGNVAIGSNAMLFNISGNENTAIGNSALIRNTIGIRNVTIGTAALSQDTSGNQNTVIGYSAGNENKNGSGNVFLGYQAGYFETGSNKLYVANSLAGLPLIYGDFATGRIGLGTTSPGGLLELGLDQGRKPLTNTWTIVSDERLKNIDGAYEKGLSEILKLNPVMYHYKNNGERKFDEKILQTQAFGFRAQDVQKIFPECVGTDDDGYLNLNIHAILIAYVNAIKELSEQNNALKSENEQMKADYVSIIKDNENMKLDIREIKSQLRIEASAVKGE